MSAREISISVDERTLHQLQNVAQEQDKSLTEVVREAIATYLAKQSHDGKRFSFIGIGHSGQQDISTRAEDVLQEEVKEHTGWSLDQ